MTFGIALRLVRALWDYITSVLNQQCALWKLVCNCVVPVYLNGKLFVPLVVFLMFMTLESTVCLLHLYVSCGTEAYSEFTS